ncbi:hypothetical protein [Paraburkholderia sp. DHOC27]|uniref:hypothetical protein n=1 Tax=Paraburkholderia sp. DHOC27 TaxID=2303330 RepID=UPI000E3BC966|nr:hypothetical protein [Paraburkholderia sp. DHOC27]RFU48291.1 hypothetical protein D0B32_00095 [Paraburkholderia sp. DHOC27]
MPKAAQPTPFQLFERVVIGLYDGGVLSPAVLERVAGGFAHTGMEWDGALDVTAVDGRSLHEVVVLTMLPGDALQSVFDSFASVIEHIAGASRAPATKKARGARETRPRARASNKTGANEAAGADDLLTQLSDSAPPDKRRRAKAPSAPTRSGGFNPLLNAAPPRSKKA